TSVGAHDLPEEAVIRVPAGVVAYRGPDVVGQLVEAPQDVVDVGVRPIRAVERGVRLVDVGLMVLVVVDAHRLLVDVGLEGVVVVRKIRYGVSHSPPPWTSVGLVSAYPSASEKPVLQLAWFGSQPSSRLAFALEAPRSSVAMITANRPATSRASHVGTLRGGLAPRAAA